MIHAAYSYDTADCKFTGKEHDNESGLDDFGARYFSSSMGRWANPDWSARPATVPYAQFGDPQSLNLYLYVRNDPVSQADADGHITDYYSPDGKKLGNDGVNNGAVAIARYGADKTSDGTVNVATICAAGCVTIETSTGSAIQASVTRTELPAGADTKGGFHEEGFTQDKDGTNHVAASGPAARPGDSEAHITKTLTSKTAIDEHTHPSGTKNSPGSTTIGGSRFQNEPSDKDIKGARNTPDPGQNILHIEAAAGNRTVYFYNEHGVYAQVPLDAFPK
jgi:RHS repeat-associated protein